MDRVRLAAFSAYLDAPMSPSLLPTNLILDYWHNGSLCNRFLDALSQPISVGKFWKHSATMALRAFAQMSVAGQELEPRIVNAIGRLGPLSVA
jgi:hypothetical protein